MTSLMEQVLTPILKQLISEQDDLAAAAPAPAPAPAGPAGPGPDVETNNAPSDNKTSPFTPAEKKFLGKFDAYGSKQLGVIYSISDIGIREFLARSGKDLNLNSNVLLSLLHNGVIKIIPYTGWGRNDDYTIELQLSLDDIVGLGDEDRKKIEKSAETTAGASGVEVAGTIKYGNLLAESVKIAKKLLKSKLDEAKKSDIKIYTDNSRLLKRFPKEFIYHLRKIVRTMDKKTKNNLEKERLVADILDNLQVNLKLSPKDVKRSYEFHRNQKRLQKILNKES
jgi:hypothetical protein